MQELTKLSIPAGSFQAFKKTPVVLQAYLGTCVGLALHCPTTGVGGLIHLLLPEPVSSTGISEPKKYATTGIPLFLKAIQEAGADMKAIKACLAGGALVGPLTQQDLNLDIGGRTAEAARGILEAHDIEIERSETGGFFTCCLELDMAAGHFAIQPAGQNKLSRPATAQTTSRDAILQSLELIKPIPQVALKILRMTNQPDYDINSVTKEIRQDQVISARIMKLVNSALFATKRTIDSLDHALVYLGREMLVKLILSAAVHGYFGQSEMGYSLCKGGLYHHATGCANVAEALARKTRKADPGIAYTAGLLHDIGKVVLDQHVGSTFPHFYRKVIEEDQSALETERQLFGIDHTQIGHLLATQWSFPSSLIEIIRNHHEPEANQEHAELGQVVFLADLLMSRFHIGLEVERIETQKLEACFKILDLENGHIADLVDLIPLAVFQEDGGVAPPDET
jgi:putative nucleotidyltransferase with HDIG domain